MENDNKKPKKPQLKKEGRFYCKKCDFRCSHKNDFRKHKTTAKHLKNINGNKITESVDFICEICGKEYKHRSGLSRHKKKCIIVKNKSVEKMGKMGKNVTMLPKKNDNIKTRKIEMSEKDAEINALKIQILEKELKHKDQIIDILKTKGNTTNNNNTNNFNNCNNKNLTVNLYLNEHCKDAMNLTDFVNQITVQLEDILFQDKTTSAEGLSNIITKQLKNLEPTERPIHCTDHRRQHFYIKEGKEWKQKTGDKEMEKSVRVIQIKQLHALKEWEDEHPNYMHDERLQARYNKYMEKILYGCGDQAKMEKNVKAVKKNISKNIMIKDAMNDFKMEDFDMIEVDSDSSSSSSSDED
jgi:hypothetical protein